MTEENKKLVIFDFDGVLVNTIDWAYELHKEYNPGFSREVYDSFVLGNFIDGIGKAVEGGHIIPEKFDEKYEKNLMTLSIKDVLKLSIRELSKDFVLGIVSSSPSSYIKEFLEQEKIFGCFSEVLGVDVHRSKVLKINNFLSKYGALPERAVYITDTLGDIKEARECKVDSIAVLWGQHRKEVLEKGNPVKIVDDPRNLISTIKDVLK